MSILKYLFFGALLLLTLNNVVFAVPPLDEKTPPQNAASQPTPEQINAMVKELDEKREKISNYIDNQKSPQATVASKLRDIINAIELQSQNLVNLIMGKNPSRVNETKQLNSVIDNLESQQESLSHLINTNDQTKPAAVEKAVPSKAKSLPVFSKP